MIIALTGRAGSGKDTVAEIIQELYPDMHWQVKGFADKLRQIASLLTGIPAEQMKRQEVKERVLDDEWWYYEHGYTRYKIPFLESEVGDYDINDLEQPTVRVFLQRIGTDAIRNNLHPNAWITALMCDYIRIEKIGNDHFFGKYNALKEAVWPNWIITDLRFPNELEAIKSRQGICIRVVRPDNPYPASNHISETSLDDVELPTIINDGNLDQLRFRVKEVFDPIVHRLRTGNLGVG